MSSIFGGGGKTETVQNNSPWGPSQGFLQDIFNRGSGQYYKNYENGGISPQLGQGLGLLTQRGLNGSPQTQAAQSQNLATINGDYTDLSKNPAAQSAMNTARSQINSQFMGDNFGNSAHQEWLGKGLMSAAAPYYEAERNRQQQAIGMAPGLANQDYTDIGQVLASAQIRDQAPWQNLFNYQQAVTGPGGTSTTEQPYFSNPLGSAAGGATAGYLIGGPWGAAIGGGLGLLSGRR